MPTRRELLHTKWERMRKLLETLQQGPLSASDACRWLGMPQNRTGLRTVENYLAELRGIGLVHYDPANKVYEAAGVRKRIFTSRDDYELALKHSRGLVLSSKLKLRLDQTEPALALDELVFTDEASGGDKDYICLKQHLKTGYFEEVYIPMQRYRQLLDETGISKCPSFPKLFCPEFSSETPDELVAEAASMRGSLPSAEGMKEYAAQLHLDVDVKKLREIMELRDSLVGKVYSIVYDIKHGIPLRGCCDSCPDRSLTISSGQA